MSFNRSKEDKEVKEELGSSIKQTVFFYRRVMSTFIDTRSFELLCQPEPGSINLTNQELWDDIDLWGPPMIGQSYIVVEAVAVVKEGVSGLFACINNIEDIIGFRTSEKGALYPNPDFQATKKREEAEARLAAKRLFLIAKWSSHPALDKNTVAKGILPFIASPEILFKAKNPQSTGQEKDNKATEQATSTLGKRQS